MNATLKKHLDAIKSGFANSALFRLQSRGGAWRYYINLDRLEN